MTLHSAASCTKPVYQALSEDLLSAGVNATFGLMSDDTAVFIGELEQNGIRFFGARHENNAVAMAEGYGSASGKLGVAVIGRGPGLANCVNALLHCSRTGTPLLVIVGEAPRNGTGSSVFGPDLKEMDMQALSAALQIESFVATSGRTARQALSDAMWATSSGKTVLLYLPVDVQREVSSDAPPFCRETPAPPAQPGRSAAIRVAVDLLNEARRPIILAGYGAYLSGARDLLLAMADRTGALLLTTLKAKGLFCGDPRDLGVAGSFSTSLARRLVEDADCVLVVGAGLNALTSSLGEFLPDAPLIQIDTAMANIGRYSHADVAIVGDASTAITSISSLLNQKSDEDKPYHAAPVMDSIRRFDIADDFVDTSSARHLDGRALAIGLNNLVSSDQNVVLDIGNFFSIAPFIDVVDPGRLKYTYNFGSIGLGFGTALGVAAAHPDRRTSFFVGDGSLLMTLGELETVAREELPLLIVVLNDHAYGAESHFLSLRDHAPGKSIYPDIDFVPIAEGLGIEGYTIRTLGDLSKLGDSLGDAIRPILLDCKINPAVAGPFLSEFMKLEDVASSSA